MIQRKHGKISLKNKRTIVISDIHGNLELFQRLLEKVHYTPLDTLIIVGDIIEKGPRILDTYEYIKELNQRENVYILNGNCEWAIHDLVTNPKVVEFMHHYLAKQPNSLLHEILKAENMNYKDYSGKELQSFFQKRIASILETINSFYTTLESEDYVFVHAGIENRKDYENSDLHILMEQQRFYDLIHPLDQYVVVGHFPTSNYIQNKIDNRIIIDKDKRMICLDGGNIVKKIGQLNALIITDHLETAEVHPHYLTGIVKEDYLVEDSLPHKIAWPNFEVRIIEKKEEFTLCEKLYNQERLMIKNEYLYQREGHYYAKDDYEDHHFSILKGERVEIMEIAGSFSYILYHGEIGWIPTSFLQIPTTGV